jgi:hypothetical protein
VGRLQFDKRNSLFLKPKKEKIMKYQTTIFIATFILAGCASTPQKRNVELSEQDDFSCQMHGLAGGMLAQRRDDKLTKDQAIADIKANFARFDTSTKRNRLAVEDAVGSLDLIANTVFDLRQHNPKTFLYAFLPVCISQKTGHADKARAASFFNKTLDCQTRNPLSLQSEALDRRDAQSINLQQCINNNVRTLFGT